jgi:hypothetical protein
LIFSRGGRERGKKRRKKGRKKRKEYFKTQITLRI